MDCLEIQPLKPARFILCCALLFTAVQFTSVSAAPIRMIAERDTPSAGGPDLLLLSYPSLTDLVNNTNRTDQVLQLALSSSFSLAGFTTDGSGYRMIAERDTPSAGGPDLLLLSYPSLTDLVSNTNRTDQVLQLPLSANFSLAGFDIQSESTNTVPEPSGLALLLLGLTGIATVARPRQHRNARQCHGG